MNQYIDIVQAGLAAVLAFLSLAGPTSGQVGPAERAPDFFLKDLQGNAHSISQYEGRFVVLEWMNFRCRTVDAQYKSGYLPELQQRYAEEDVVWLSVVSGDPMASLEKLERQVEKRGGRQSAVLLDETGEIGRIYGVERTPQVFLIDPEGRMIYQGAVDNQPVLDDTPGEAPVNYLDQAMLQVQSGKPVSIVSTAPYGCPFNE